MDNVTLALAKAYAKKSSPQTTLNGADGQINFEASNNKLVAVISSETPISLDTIAYEDKTYRDIFVTGNMLSFGDFENGLTGTTSGAGSPVITDEAYRSGAHALKCFGSSSYRDIAIKRTGLPQTTIYGVASVRIDRYVKGNCGMQVVCGDITNICADSSTEGFNRVSGVRVIGTGSTITVHVGSYSSANLDGYIDDVALIDLSIFNTMPSQAQMDKLYDAYINILLGATTITTEKPYIISDEHMQETEYSDVACVSAFMSKVNEKATELGMTNSVFTYPSGINSGKSTARDLVKLFVASTAYDELMRIWSYDAKTITVNGNNARNEEIKRSDGSTLTDSYYIFGRKTGSWTTADGLINNLGVIGEVSGRMVAGVVMKATTSDGRFSAMKQMFDIAQQVIENPDTDVSILSVADAECCCCCLIPSYNISCYDRYPFSYLYEQNSERVYIPASVTKVITAMVMLDYVKQLDENIEIIASDITGGSGAILNEGDIISWRDALYAMMLPSSNTAAQAVARCVGKKILQNA